MQFFSDNFGVKYDSYLQIQLKEYKNVFLISWKEMDLSILQSYRARQPHV